MLTLRLTNTEEESPLFVKDSSLSPRAFSTSMDRESERVGGLARVFGRILGGARSGKGAEVTLAKIALS